MRKNKMNLSGFENQLNINEMCAIKGGDGEICNDVDNDCDANDNEIDTSPQPVESGTKGLTGLAGGGAAGML